MMDISILKNAGIDYDKGLNRFLGDSELYEKVLLTFLEDETMAQAETAFAAKDYKLLFECAHSLKGMSGNMDMTNLYVASCDLTEILRNCEHPNETNTARLFEELQRTYRQIREGIISAREK